jgi:predicted DNA-binding transcriptional regulator YafY
MKVVAASAKAHTIRWGAERRLEFIDFRLLWEGTINRGELVDYFGISIQQASADLARYIELAPNNLAYDKNLKTYRSSDTFEPAIAQRESHAYLNQLSSVASGAIASSAALIGWMPPNDLVQYPTRPIPANTLVEVLKSIRGGLEIEIQYQSMRRPTATVRWIAPHAIAFDGFRWHVRAWCSENCDFRDFVLSRIQRVMATRPNTSDESTDLWWHTAVEVIVSPRTGLTPEQSAAIEVDYGMVDGCLTLSSRKALAFYLLRQLQLDRETDEPPVSQPLMLVNRSDLNDVLVAAIKAPKSINPPLLERY